MQKAKVIWHKATQLQTCYTFWGNGQWLLSPQIWNRNRAQLPPQFWAQVPPISDSSFPLHFGLLPLQGESFVKGAD